MDPNRIDAGLARRLVSRQFPRWAGLPVSEVELQGWDNRSFRLGDGLLVRLPSGPGYALAVAKEQAWLPRLAPQLPLPIPVPVGLGTPDEGYPYPWSVYEWLDGRPAAVDRVDPSRLAVDLAPFMVALQAADPTGGPEPGPHCAWRGAQPSVYDDDTLLALRVLGDRVDQAAARRVWADALAAVATRAPVWVHGDVAAGNLLVRGGRLSAVIDFGGCAVGDPACDLVIAWTFLDPPARQLFADGLGLDAATWARARGWALWKALITLVGDLEARPDRADGTRRVLAAVLGDPVRPCSC